MSKRRLTGAIIFGSISSLYILAGIASLFDLAGLVISLNLSFYGIVAPLQMIAGAIESLSITHLAILSLAGGVIGLADSILFALGKSKGKILMVLVCLSTLMAIWNIGFAFWEDIVRVAQASNGPSMPSAPKFSQSDTYTMPAIVSLLWAVAYIFLYRKYIRGVVKRENEQV